MNHRSLVYDYMRDLIGDIRHARNQEGFAHYALKCEEDLNRIFRVRHTVRVDAYGIPYLFWSRMDGSGYKRLDLHDKESIT